VLHNLHLHQGWSTVTHRRATYFVKDSPEGLTYVYVYRKGVIDLTRRQLFITKQVTLKVLFNNKTVNLAELGKIMRKIGLLCAVLNFMIYSL